jgi:hypothetical protein
MDATVIILIIIILVLVYFLYSATKKSNTNVKSKLYNLNNSNSSISSADLTNPKSQSFSYSAWVYVNTWKNGEKAIYYASTNGAIPPYIIGLALDATSPILRAVVGTQPITITNNFPIQKWVYVVISVDSNIVDCYLDGKLVSSTQLQNIPTIPATYSINFGTFDAYLTGFTYSNKPLNPQQVWSNYMTGNGYTGGKYGVNFAITKDDAVISQISY